MHTAPDAVAETTFESDWLGSQPIFYNESTGKVSFRVDDVIDYTNLEFHPEGLNNYLDVGYSILGQTPVRNVKFLPPCSKVTKGVNGKLTIVRGPDVSEQHLNETSDEEDVLHKLTRAVREWEHSFAGDFILPISGGYDSRLLAVLVENKSRLRCFTYGVTDNQSRHSDVVYARRVAQTLNLKWKQIELGDFHQYLDDWIKLFGVSTHAHGMYQIEFFSKLVTEMPPGSRLLSGIIGDAWSGNVRIPEIQSPSDVMRLGFSHGLSATSKASVLHSKRELLEEYYEANKARLASPLVRVIESMRFKMLLLSYLFTIPRTLGFLPWSPFLLPEVALSMLTIAEERKQNRVWQQDFFRRHGLAVEQMHLKVKHENSIALQATRTRPLPPLDPLILREVISPAYVEWINRTIRPLPTKDLLWRVARVKGVRGLLFRAGVSDQRTKAYNAYMTLKPIESLLQQRERTSRRIF
jgi:polyphenol oxidase-like protein/asparagine synthase